MEEEGRRCAKKSGVGERERGGVRKNVLCEKRPGEGSREIREK